MLSTVYKKNTDNTLIDISLDTQPETTSNCSFAHYIRAGLAITSVVGTVALVQKIGFLSSSWRSRDAAPGNSLDNPYPLISSQDVITFTDNSLPIQPRHAKRAIGGEFQINTYTTSGQTLPSAATLSTGDFVVVWQSDGQDGDAWGIYGQRFSNIGIPQGSEFQVNTYTTGSQGLSSTIAGGPSIAALNSGDFVVVWQSNGQDGSGYGVYGQRYSSTGVPQGAEFQINTYTTSDQEWPFIADLTTGDFVVVWHSNGQDGSGYGIYGQRFSSIGVPQGAEFQINTYTTDYQWKPSVAGLISGDFVVVWRSEGQDSDLYGVYGQRYSSIGVPQGAEFQINTYTINSQLAPSITGLTTGDFVVVWQSYEQDYSLYGIYGQHYSSTGIAQGGEFQINTYTSAHQNVPSVAALNFGNYVVVWESHAQDGDTDGVYGQRFLSISIPQGSEFRINTYTTNMQRYPFVITLNSNDFVVVWQSYEQEGDGYGIYGRIYFAPALINTGLTVLSVSELFNIEIGATNTTALSFGTIEITQIDPSLTINWDDTKVQVDTVTIPDITSGRKVEITSDGTNTNPTITTKTCKDGVCSEEKTTTLATAFSLDNGNGEQIPAWLKVGGGIGAGVLVAGIVGLGIFAVCRHNEKQKPRRQQTHETLKRHAKFGQTTDEALSENPNAQSVPSYAEYGVEADTQPSFLEEGANAVRQIFSPKTEFV